MAWTNIPLGSVMHSNPGIADVLALNKSYTSTTLRIYEVKRNRSDFWRDVNRGKYSRYFPFCHQLFFAVPAGMVKKEELPEGCGLTTLSDKGWHVQKAAPRRDCNIPTELLLALLMRGYQDYWPKQRDLSSRQFDYKGLQDAAREFGRSYASDIAQGHVYLQEAHELQKKIDEALGKKNPRVDLSLWALRSEVDRLMGQYRDAPEIIDLTNIVMRMVNGTAYKKADAVQKVVDRLREKEELGNESV